MCISILKSNVAGYRFIQGFLISDFVFIDLGFNLSFFLKFKILYLSAPFFQQRDKLTSVKVKFNKSYI